MTINHSPLGKETTYPSQYDPNLLFPISRSIKRAELGLESSLPFSGTDFWNGFELSWLDKKGKPQVALALFEISCFSENLIESKSFKLYLNSFNQTHFDSHKDVQELMINDLTKATQGNVKVKLVLPNQFSEVQYGEFSGVCLDDLDITTDVYEVEPAYLKTSGNMTDETLYSHLLKSNCLVTSQPDWATVLIRYKGNQINHEGLLKYIISYRNHSGFHEQCVEKMFVDIMRYCNPTLLTVYARYTRRGGLDINPFRSNFEKEPPQYRLARQ